MAFMPFAEAACFLQIGIYNAGYADDTDLRRFKSVKEMNKRSEIITDQK